MPPLVSPPAASDALLAARIAAAAEVLSTTIATKGIALGSPVSDAVVGAANFLASQWAKGESR